MFQNTVQSLNVSELRIPGVGGRVVSRVSSDGVDPYEVPNKLFIFREMFVKFSKGTGESR